MFKKNLLVAAVLLSGCYKSFSQNNVPKITGYASIVHPIVTLSSEPPAHNFKDYYVVGFPFGINYWKTPKVAFSFEVAPFIKAENGSSKTSYFLFHPGVVFALGKGFSFAQRMAFETTGRYGLTSIFSKVIIRGRNCNYYVAVPVSVRFGNDKPTAASIAFQLGVSF